MSGESKMEYKQLIQLKKKQTKKQEQMNNIPTLKQMGKKKIK